MHEGLHTWQGDHEVGGDAPPRVPREHNYDTVAALVAERARMGCLKGGVVANVVAYRKCMPRAGSSV